MESSTFNELTKVIASTTSRREALRRIGGILGGAALAGLFPGLALAKNKTCAQFCASVFGANTPAAEQCAADAAHGTGLCYTCGPAGPNLPICCRESNGLCTSYSSATCCSGVQTCLANGTCAQDCVSHPFPCNTYYGCTPDINYSSYFCLESPGDGACGSDIDCPTGMFCDVFGFCWTAGAPA